MEKVAELVDSDENEGGSGEDKFSHVLSSLPSSLDSYLDEQKEKPSELGMIDNDILALANQVGDDMENSVEGANIAAQLSFLEEAEAKDGTEADEGDNSLAFLGLEDTKMEMEQEDIAMLVQQDMPEFESEDGSDYVDESEDEEDDEEESDEELEDKSGAEEDKSGEKTEDEGAFGEVSFYDAEPGTAPDNVGKPAKKAKTKKLTKKKKRKAEDAGEGSSQKPKRKRRKKKAKKKSEDEEDNEEDEDSDIPKSGNQMRRKNIRSILSEKDLDKDMLDAQNEEMERQKRLMELKKYLLKESANANAAGAAASASSAGVGTSTKTASASTEIAEPKEKDSQLKSLLQVAEEEAQKEADEKDRKLLDKEVVKVKKETRETSPPSDVITLSSETSDSEDMGDEDSDGVMVVPSDEEDEDEDAEDVNNGGAHIDDSLNLPDQDGRVKVNIGHPADDPDIFLAPQIAQAIKPHQIGGIRFLYDNLVESLERFRTSPGFGCILAHSMGLGKTIQLISFIDIFIRCTGGKRVLCIVPINTIQNWMAEFNYWLPEKEKLHPDDNLTQSRIFPLYIVNDSMKTTASRAAVLQKWNEAGGVLLMGYEMFRLLSSKRVNPSKKAKSRSKKPAQPEVIDVEEEDKNKSMMLDMHSTLVDPGPDLVMCDEGHRIKNSSAVISQSLKNIKTRRRVVLTGYPLQNNLMEYWCMVDFVRPSFLGTKTEFSNMFERPIMNGQCVDSTAQDKKVMRHRSYVLHNLLEGFVQRRGHTVLQLSLPPKSEHVFLIRLSPVQRKIYCEFMDAISDSGLCSWANNNPLKAFAVCCKIWNHPDVLHEVVTQRNADKDNDLDIDTGEGGTSKKKGGQKTPAVAAAAAAANTAASAGSPAPSVPSLTPSASSSSLSSMAVESGSEKNPITYDWAEPVMKDYVSGVLENSGKMVIMNTILEECLAIGDRILVFSQSLLTLNKIEEFLGKLKVPRPEINEAWCKNRTYFRLDGSTSAQDREKLINQFNDPEGNAWLFLLSTKAGCLGINLIGANRVIVIDASWNPCHDCQAVCRVYRFGQNKSCYVYRLVTDNTLEKRIYDRQISKQGMSDRIIDDMNIENKFTRRQVENLLDFEDQDFPVQDFSNASSKYENDPVLVRVLHKQGYWLTKQPFTHESLLIDRKELRLSGREKRLAKEGYARDKRLNITYTRPSYAAFYPQQGVLPNRLPLNNRYNYATYRRGPIVRPIASVRPIISASTQNGGEKIKQFGGQPLRPGVTIHQVITTTEIVLPGTNTGTQAGPTNKISAGQKILVIKTPKGVYIRTNDGKMFAVRSKGGLGGAGVDAGLPATSSTMTTTTLTSSNGNQVLISQGLNISSAPGGKKPPIIIVSNKKGLPLSMARGGSIIRTLPYGSTNLLSSLRPNILKASTQKSADITTTTTSTSTKASPTAEGDSNSAANSLLSQLMSEDDEKSKDSQSGTANGGPQSDGPKKHVIVLPSLAVRTPRPQPKIPVTNTISSGAGSTVVIMPTKPVVSMGTKRPPKNSKKKSNKGKETASAAIGDSSVQKDSLKPMASLLAPSGDSVPGVNEELDKNKNLNAPSTIPPSGNPSGQPQHQPHMMGSMVPPTHHDPSGNNQMMPPPFPDLNHMWQSNFGSAPPSGPSPLPGNNNNSNNSAPNNSVPMGQSMNPMDSNNPMPGMMSMDANQPPNMQGQSNAANNSSSNDNSSSNLGGASGNMDRNDNANKNPTITTSANDGMMSFNPSFGSNPYAGSNMGPYGMGPSNMMPPSMNPYMPSFMQSSPFGQGMHGHGQGQGQQGPAGNVGNMPVFGQTSNSGQGQFNSSPSPSSSSPFGMNSHQSPAPPPPYGSTASNDGRNAFQNAPPPNNAPAFGFQPAVGSMNYGMHQPNQGDQQQPLPSTSNQLNINSFNPNPLQSNPGPMFGLDANNPNPNNPSPYSTQQTQPPSQLQQQQQPPPQQSPAPLSIPSSSSSPSSGPIPSIGSYADSGLGSLDSNTRDNSPYSLTLLGVDSPSMPSTSTKSKRSRSNQSSSSKSNKNSSSSGNRDSSSNKLPKPTGVSNSSLPPPSSPRNSTATPDRSNSASSNFRSTPDTSGSSGPLSYSYLDGPGGISNSSTSIVASTPSSLSNPQGFRPVGSSSFSSATGPVCLMSGGSPFASDAGLGTSAFRAHPSSTTNNLSSNPLFRLDGAGGINSVGGVGPSPLGGAVGTNPLGGGVGTTALGGVGTSPLGYNSGMSAFTSPAGNTGSTYGTPNAFGAYGSTYAPPAPLPFSSPAMLPPQSMMGYPQAGLGYPTMSSLMMSAPPPPAPSTMGGAMWPMMPPAMMGGAYGYPAHPSGLGYSAPGLDGQGFGN